MVEKSTLFTHTFLNETLTGRKSTSLLVKLQANENIWGSITLLHYLHYSNFKKLNFARLFSLNFSGKSPWCSPFRLKFESYNLQHYKKNCRRLVFWEFTEQLPLHIIFGWLHCYEVTLVKKCNKPLLQKRETKIIHQKQFIKSLFKVNKKNKLDILIINQIMPKLPTLIKL